MKSELVISWFALAISVASIAVSCAAGAQAQEINATVRSAAEVREFKRRNPCPSTGSRDPYASCPGYVVDHGLSLCMSGPDTQFNLFWQEVEASYLKDNHERRICRTIATLREENQRLREALKEAGQ